MRGRTNRRRKTLTKVSRKPKKPKTASERFQASALEYDGSASQFSNFQRLGLLADANQIGRKTEKGRVTGFNPRVKGPMAEPASSSELHPLELEVPPALKTVKLVPLGERQVLTKLLERHGDDVAAMARDMRLNTLQHTAAHLRRRLAKMRAEDAEDASISMAAATEGVPPPPPGALPARLCKKRTRDPNPAFGKKSRNFT
jgi:hypothetical protein